MYKCKFFLFLLICFFVNGNPSQKESFQFAKKALTEYFRTGEVPDYLSEALTDYQMPHLFRPDNEQVLDFNVVCSMCKVVVDLVLQERASGTSKEQLQAIVSLVCETLGIENKEVCEGTISRNIDIFLYIADNSTCVTSERVCALILQDQKCDKGNNFEWTIDIPEGQTIDKPDAGDESDSFQVLQISDFHYDPMYQAGKNAKCSEPLCCQSDHEDPVSEGDACGYWSEYDNADIPWYTVQELIRQVKTHTYDYVYYTGDIISHRVWSTSIENNTRDLKQVFQEFRHSFPVPVYPIFGNHEPHPLNAWSSENESDISISTSWLYKLAADEWSSWLPETTRETILRGGYYTISPKSGFRIIVLNSNVCYTFNWWLIDSDVDPYGQLQWLANTLLEAENNKESVHILSHIPTGHSSCLQVWSREFRKIVDRFANTITGQFNGHTHKDEFAIYYNRSEPTQAINVAFNGASVTTYTKANPSYKLYSVDNKAFTVLDYEEWTFNLTLANEKGDQQLPEWYKLYSFKDAYGVDSMNPTDIDGLVNRMATDHSIIDQYNRFFYRDGDLGMKDNCTDDCKKKHLCTMVTTQFGDDDQCERLKEIYDKSFQN